MAATDSAASGWPTALSRLSIRARLALWYGFVLFAVLAIAGVWVVWLQTRLGLQRVDERLRAATVSVAGVMANELEEGLDLQRAATDMLAELTLSDEAFAVLGPDGVVGRQLGRQPNLTDDVIAAGSSVPATVAAAPGVRLLSVPRSHGTHSFRIVAWTSLAPLDAEQRNLQRAMVLGIPLAVALAIAGGLGISRRSLRPLEQMAGQTTAIDSRDPSTRLSGFNPHDELGTLGRSINALLDRLQLSLEQQRSFMADASHQLRTPVSVVRTATQVTLGRDDRTTEEYRDALEIVSRQAERLSRMVDDMFLLARADAGARPLQTTPLYLDELVEECAADVTPLAATKNIVVSTETTGETPFVGDEHLLRQMLTNLLDNAVRHTPAEGRVRVALTRSAQATRLVVSDTGPGLGRADADRIFDRFVRLDSTSPDSGGGLGLPIARWIAEAHGGTLTVAASSATGGQFVVTLPMTR